MPLMNFDLKLVFFINLDAEVKSTTWTPKVCEIMAFGAVIMGVGLLFCILLGL